MKVFNVIKGDVIPSKSNNSANEKLGFSDYFIAKVRFVSGHERITQAVYDFNKKRWSSSYSGFEEVIEYYTETDNFSKWLKDVNNIDLNTLFEMYNSFDEEDK